MISRLQKHLRPRRIWQTSPHRRDTPVAGFSLAEILVVLAILAVITGMTTVFLGQVRQVSQRHAERTNQQELNAITRYLERTLETALALPVDISDNQNRAFFVGNAQRVTFVSASRIGLQEAAMRTKTIALEKDAGKLYLIQAMTARRFDASNQPDDAPLTVSIIRDIDTVSFEYLAPGKGESSWQAGWKQDRMLPRAVRFTIGATRNGRSYSSKGFARLRGSAL